VIDENHRYPVLETRLADECLHPAFEKNFFLAKKFPPPVGGAVFDFFSSKKVGRGEEISMSGLERLGRLSLPRRTRRRAWRQAESQRCPNQGNYRALVTICCFLFCSPFEFSTLGDLVVLSMIALVLASATVAFPHLAAANDLDHRQVREAQFRAYAAAKFH
jgi:hypothetical protein